VTGHLLHDLLRTSAEAHAELPAAIDRHRELTYAELERRANRLARLLLDLGVTRGDRVGLFLEKSLESVVAVYGILKAGAAYVPLDPQAPPARLAYIARNAELRVLVTGLEKEEVWNRLVAEDARPRTLVVLNADHIAPEHGPPGVRLFGARALDAYEDTPPPVKANDGDLAYILYTSGSTGDPKGVMLSHLNAITFVDWAVDQIAVAPDDRLSSHAPLHFDLSIFDLFATAKAGAAVVLLPPKVSLFPIEVARWIDENEITIWYSVPSALTMLVLHGRIEPGHFARLRSVLFAGEVFPVKYLVRLMESVPHARFYNLYGPTETNVCTWYEVPPLSEGRPESIPIGKAISNVDVFVSRDDGTIAPPGEIGELCVQGATVMQGYWGDPEASAQALAPHPSARFRDQPVYRTGDLVKQAEDGNLVFVGRRDAQVKRRGHRIELGEIETALQTHPSVVECAAIAVPDEVTTTRIIARVVASGDVRESDLIEVCSARLPRYALPDTVEFRSALPKTSTGKIDRKALLVS
jgi:amino acid adenylation domain-containing protein